MSGFGGGGGAAPALPTGPIGRDNLQEWRPHHYPAYELEPKAPITNPPKFSISAGSFGVVAFGTHKLTGTKVAIKRFLGVFDAEKDYLW